MNCDEGIKKMKYELLSRNYGLWTSTRMWHVNCGFWNMNHEVEGMSFEVVRNTELWTLKYELYV